MAGLKDLKVQIENANSLGRQNLSDKGVEVEETATTYEIMQGIAEVSSGGGTDEIEILIDESGVLDSTEGTATEKVEQLIGKAEELDIFMNITGAQELFFRAKSFPTKAVVNLPNATTVYQAFAKWPKGSIPLVEEITLNAPNVTNGNISNAFYSNNCVKKVIINTTDECTLFSGTFNQSTKLEEVVLNFSTKNIQNYSSAFPYCSKLKTIDGVLDFSSATNTSGMFSSDAELEDVTFARNSLSLSMSLAQSSKLTADSVQSIIDGLATVETAQTLTLNSAIILTDEQKATINAKGWTLAQ